MKITLKGIFVVGILFMPTSLVRAEPGPDDVKQAAISRFSKLLTCSTLSERTVTYMPPDTAISNIEGAGGKAFVLLKGERTFIDRVWSLDGRYVRWEEQKRGLQKDAPHKDPGADLKIYIVTPDRFESLSIPTLENKVASTQPLAINTTAPSTQSSPDFSGPFRVPPDGEIAAPEKVPAMNLFVGLGLQVMEERKLLDVGRISSMDAVVDGDHATLTLINNQETHRWTYDIKNHFALTRYEIFIPSRSKDPFFVSVASDFRETDGIALPGRMIQTTYSLINDHLSEAEKTDIKIDTYNFKDITNTVGKYIMVWPARTRIIDDRTHGQIRIGDKAQTMTDEQIFDRAKMLEDKKVQDLKAAQDRIDKTLQK